MPPRESQSHAARSPEYDRRPGGLRLSRTPRNRRSPAVLRSRFRTLFFALLALAAIGVGQPIAATIAAFGVLVALASVIVARFQGERLTHTFVVLDWLLLGCSLAVAGGVHSWLLPAVPVLVAGQLVVSPRHEWPYLLAPTLVLFVVIAIADPHLGGNRLAAAGTVILLVAGGAVTAHRLALQRGRRARPARIDAVTGFYAPDHLLESVETRMALAAADGSPLSLVYLSVQHYGHSRSVLGARSSEALIKGVARRLQGRLAGSDLAFRLPPDAFVLVLPGRAASEARGLADAAAAEIAAGLIAGRRQTLAVGTASFPAARSPQELVATARLEARSAAAAALAAPQAVELATAL
jgi:GGDEF domain-containing protein